MSNIINVNVTYISSKIILISLLRNRTDCLPRTSEDFWNAFIADNDIFFDDWMNNPLLIWLLIWLETKASRAKILALASTWDPRRFKARSWKKLETNIYFCVLLIYKGYSVVNLISVALLYLTEFNPMEVIIHIVINAFVKRTNDTTIRKPMLNIFFWKSVNPAIMITFCFYCNCFS